MRLRDYTALLFMRSTIALVLAVAVISLPVAGVMALPVEPVDTDDDPISREVELVAPGQSDQPVWRPSRSALGGSTHHLSPAPLLPLQPVAFHTSRAALGLRLRC
jgi:hypothetical protein